MASTYTELKESVTAGPSPASQKNVPSEYLLLGAVLLFAAAAYAATVRFDFVYDDQLQIVDNTLVHSWRYVPAYFLGRTWHGGFQNASLNYFRPLNFVWIRLNDALFGPHPAGWHVTTILLHLLATTLAYLVARKVVGRPLVAGLTALVFGIHPMTHEVVAWVSGTTESLWAVFAFAAFLLYLKFHDTGRTRWLVASCVLYAAAVLSKEPAIVLPGIVFAHRWIYGSAPGETRPDSRDIWRRLLRPAATSAAYIPIFAAYLVLRFRALDGFSHLQQRVSFATFVLTLPALGFFYLKQWLLPVRLTEFYEMPISTGFDFKHVLLPIGGLLLVAGLVWMARRSLGTREVAFASVWILLPLLPAMDFVALPPGDLVHDRYFYLSSFGAALLLALALEKFAKGPLTLGVPRRLCILALALASVLAYDTACAASHWRDNFEFFEHAARLAPNSIPARIGYASELRMRGEDGTAIQIFQGVLKDDPQNYLATYGLAEALYGTGMLKPAEHFFQQTRELNPDTAGAYLYLGLIAMKTQRTAEGVAEMRQALALEPLDPIYHFTLAMALEQQGNCKETISELNTVLRLQPGFPHAAEQIEKCSASVGGPTPSSGSVPAAPKPAAAPARLN